MATVDERDGRRTPPWAVVLGVFLALLIAAYVIAPLVARKTSRGPVLARMGEPPALPEAPPAEPTPEVPPRAQRVRPWRGNTVAVYDEALPTTLHPLFATTMIDVRAHELVFDRLFYRNPITNEPASRLVSEAELAADGRSLTVDLEPGVTWHDDEPVLADDVCFTVELLQDPDTPLEVASAVRDLVAECTVEDPQTAVLSLRRVVPEPRDYLGFYVLPEHVLGEAVIAPDIDFARRPIGTGPMTGALGSRSVRFGVFKNAHHDAQIEGLSLTAGGDPFVQVRTLAAGGVQGIVTVPPALRQEVQQYDGLVLKTYLLRTWWSVVMNTETGPTQNLGVRRAIEAAVDRDELRRLTIGHDPSNPIPACELISGPFLPSSPYADRSVSARTGADADAVQAHMQAAGARLVGGRWHLNGAPVQLRLGMPALLDLQAKDLLTQVANQLRSAGFEVDAQRIANDEWASRATTDAFTRRYDLIIRTWTADEVEDLGPLFHSRGAEGRGRHNVLEYRNPRADALLERFHDAATDTEARAVAHELGQELRRDLPAVFLWGLNTKSAWIGEVRGNTIAPHFYFTEFDRWRIDAR